MVLRIPFRIRRKLPCASLFFHTTTLSTPIQLLCNNRFLHASSIFRIATYKQHVSNHKVETYRNQNHAVSSLSRQGKCANDSDEEEILFTEPEEAPTRLPFQAHFSRLISPFSAEFHLF